MRVRLLSGSDPSFRYAEHKRTASFYDHEVFYYQGTKFIDEVERALVAELVKYFHCTEVEARVISGQMSNVTVFSALMDYKNRLDRKHTPKRLGYILNNHIIKGGHLSAQPMGALHDYVALDPATERSAVVNFPVLRENLFKIDVEETKKVIERYRPEFIIFGKSMVLHKEPVREIRAFVDEHEDSHHDHVRHGARAGPRRPAFPACRLKRARRSSPAPRTRRSLARSAA